MYQRVVLVGHLGADPEMRYTPNGNPVTTFRVATNRRWTDGEGNPQEETTWFRVVAWGKLAETTNQYLSKGRLVLVDGAIQTRSWEDQSGQSRQSWEVRANTVKFLGGREERIAESPEIAAEAVEEDIPF
ncbi:MAG: single-stranded DNA-binding protein [Chloroflexi bacterium]|nr:single-stranded DNA-binding protein [Chloroflexota bacterium]